MEQARGQELFELTASGYSLSHLLSSPRLVQQPWNPSACPRTSLARLVLMLLPSQVTLASVWPPTCLGTLTWPHERLCTWIYSRKDVDCVHFIKTFKLVPPRVLCESCCCVEVRALETSPGLPRGAPGLCSKTLNKCQVTGKSCLLDLFKLFI